MGRKSLYLFGEEMKSKLLLGYLELIGVLFTYWFLLET